MKSLRQLAPFRRKDTRGNDVNIANQDPLVRRSSSSSVDGSIDGSIVDASADLNADSGARDGGHAAGTVGTGGVKSSAQAGVKTGSRAGGARPVGARGGLSGGNLEVVSGVRGLPRPALRWVGPAGRIALREFDFAADSDVICGWQEDTYSLNFSDFRFTESFAAAFRHDLRRAALDPHHALFVLDEGEVIGFLWLVICENTWTGERYGYINNLYIAAARRSGGLAGELMAQADLWFKSRRIKRVRLTVTVANEAACRLYERCGYSVTRREMEKNL